MKFSERINTIIGYIRFGDESKVNMRIGTEGEGRGGYAQTWSFSLTNNFITIKRLFFTNVTTSCDSAHKIYKALKGDSDYNDDTERQKLLGEMAKEGNAGLSVKDNNLIQLLTELKEENNTNDAIMALVRLGDYLKTEDVETDDFSTSGNGSGINTTAAGKTAEARNQRREDFMSMLASNQQVAFSFVQCFAALPSTNDAEFQKQCTSEIRKKITVAEKIFSKLRVDENGPTIFDTELKRILIEKGKANKQEMKGSFAFQILNRSRSYGLLWTFFSNNTKGAQEVCNELNKTTSPKK